jgi:CheY-like chemotaxis protein
VLIVDDEPVNRMVLGRMLEHFGVSHSEASSGLEALELLGAEAFDLVLMDIHMPVMTGFQTVERLRAMCGPNRDTPVVAVTGDTTRPLSEYLAGGFDGYANKPISLALVQSMLKATRQSDADQAPRSARG